MLTLNLQHITDPLTYLRKQKLRALGLPDTTVTAIQLITPSGARYELGTMTNLELVSLIQELIDVSCDAMTIFCDQRSLYVKH